MKPRKISAQPNGRAATPGTGRTLPPLPPPSGSRGVASPDIDEALDGPNLADMAFIPSGTFTMGSDHHYPEEAPAHEVSVDGFWIDRYPVTNEEFARFVKATGYVTFAERAADPLKYPGAKPELLVPSSVVFRKPIHQVDLRNHYNWWFYVPGANWRHPLGPSSSIEKKTTHPVVHVAFEDARGLCALGRQGAADRSGVGVRRARRTERRGVRWGDEFTPGGVHLANTWQGEFPYQNLRRRTGSRAHRPSVRFRRTAMASSTWPAMSGSGRSTGIRATRTSSGAAARSTIPRGGALENSFDPCLPDVPIPRRVTKGGSYLCAPNYCRRYRPAARMAQPIDTSTCHLGFRCIVRATQ